MPAGGCWSTAGYTRASGSCGALKRGGVVLIPAFAVDRTPVLLMALRQLIRDCLLPPVPVYVDSPMALAALDVYRVAVRSGDREIRPIARVQGDDPFDPGELHLVHSPEESKRLDQIDRPCVIISASGMATGGRVVHHMQQLVPEPAQPDPAARVPGRRHPRPGAAGRCAGAEMYGGYAPVRAEVVGLPEFSAHAAADELLAWLRTAPRPPRTCYVVHGEQHDADALAARVDAELGWCAAAARQDEQVLV